MKYGLLLTIGVIILTIYMWIACLERKKQKIQQTEYETQRDSKMLLNSEDTIFVSLPCYCDAHECAKTLYDLFNHSDCPWRITVGVFHHYEAQKEAETDSTFSYELNLLTEHIIHLYEQICTHHDATSFSQNIRICIRPAYEAKGAMSARAYIQTHLFKKEKYYMTTSCRTRFLKNWDTTLLKLYKNISHPKAILTTLPQMDADESHPTFVSVVDVDLNGFPIPRAESYMNAPVRAFPSILWIPSLSFARSNLVQDVPVASDYSYTTSPLETYIMSALYWTNGWEFYSLKDCICYLDNTVTPRKKCLPVSKDALRERDTTINRAYNLLGKGPCRLCRVPLNEHREVGHAYQDMVPCTSKLGSIKSLAQFEAYCGVEVVDALNRQDDSLNTYITKNANMGTPHLSEEEEVCKYGKSSINQILYYN